MITQSCAVTKVSRVHQELLAEGDDIENKGGVVKICVREPQWARFNDARCDNYLGRWNVRTPFRMGGTVYESRIDWIYRAERIGRRIRLSKINRKAGIDGIDRVDWTVCIDRVG